MTQQINVDVIEHGIVVVEELHTRDLGRHSAVIPKKYAIAPGESYKDFPKDVQAACVQAHTEEVVAAFRALVMSATGEK